ncbi:DUF1816 domain-containing protein [Oscillatoria sp. CS-180]|uniref:DUF1816 domain-containing protein n=1 Tax=Oscillatoria sp. CS-180 TaxID=3021720 RepID=UPI002330C9F9|nr:DUF1816 domain-containing protein [Oscillatoria sp. CS-180]MDB9527315.1 DUF1816 domain-containing protein [Oscillatoria sp. CS-180]
MQLFSLDSLDPWWSKVQLETPQCVYFLGYPDDGYEARCDGRAYVEDFVLEGAQGSRAAAQHDHQDTLNMIP